MRRESIGEKTEHGKSGYELSGHEISGQWPCVGGILGSSPVVSRLKDKIGHIAQCEVSVLISGESGTGKELTARALHQLSPRANKPFVAVNCGAIPENLFENELFGHRKGAFTDASYHQEGLVREAEGGTLFLDEVGVVGPYIQVKLLRLLQEKEYRPLGDSRTHTADVRIVAATNGNLETMVRQDKFRQDLYFRLNIVSLDMPPLRERKEDIPQLADFFVKKYAREYHKGVEGISEGAMMALLSYSWPGNIRELENKIQQAVVMADDTCIASSDLGIGRDIGERNVGETNAGEIKDFPWWVMGCQAGGYRPGDFQLGDFKEEKKKVVDYFERNYLTLLLGSCRGNVPRAAKRAGKSRTAFWNLLARHHLHPGQFSGGG